MQPLQSMPESAPPPADDDEDEDGSEEDSPPGSPQLNARVRSAQMLSRPASSSQVRVVTHRLFSVHWLCSKIRCKSVICSLFFYAQSTGTVMAGQDTPIQQQYNSVCVCVCVCVCACVCVCMCVCVHTHMRVCMWKSYLVFQWFDSFWKRTWELVCVCESIFIRIRTKFALLIKQ